MKKYDEFNSHATLFKIISVISKLVLEFVEQNYSSKTENISYQIDDLSLTSYFLNKKKQKDVLDNYSSIVKDYNNKLKNYNGFNIDDSALSYIRNDFESGKANICFQNLIKS